MTPVQKPKPSPEIGEKLEEAWKWFSKATWAKVGTGVVAVLVGVWGYLGLGEGIDSADKRLDAHGQRLDTVERVLTKRFDRLDKRADALEESEQDLNEAIRKAVQRGIERGVARALRRAGN